MGKNNIGASQSSTLDGSFGKSEKSKAKKYKIIGLPFYNEQYLRQNFLDSITAWIETI